MQRFFSVRPAIPDDLEAIAAQCALLWPEGSFDEHAGEIGPILEGAPTGNLPVAFFVAAVRDQVIGFIQIGLRSHADGCDTARPVGFVEGWFVTEAQRATGVGRGLMRAAEEWAVARGCVEMASDTWLDNEGSQLAHQALGFEEVDRCVHYRKSLR